MICFQNRHYWVLGTRRVCHTFLIHYKVLNESVCQSMYRTIEKITDSMNSSLEAHVVFYLLKLKLPALYFGFFAEAELISTTTLYVRKKNRRLYTSFSKMFLRLLSTYIGLLFYMLWSETFLRMGVTFSRQIKNFKIFYQNYSWHVTNSTLHLLSASTFFSYLGGRNIHSYQYGITALGRRGSWVNGKQISMFSQ